MMALFVGVHTVGKMPSCAERRGLLTLVRRTVVAVSRSEKSAMKANSSLKF